MSKLNWKRAGLHRSRNRMESKYAGRTLDNGVFIPAPRLDSLALRAGRAMEKWLEERKSLRNARESVHRRGRGYRDEQSY